jgi:2-polyprenyl-6-methoxyphenol hydroxylase-like FAD-dependent oxidoreductase
VSTASNVTAGHDFDVVIVGASLAGSATAIMLGRAGARVALVEQRPDPDAYKRICSHYIQGSAVATLQRLELLEPMMDAGAVRSRVRFHTAGGWVAPSDHGDVPAGVNLRRQVLDPLIRDTAARTPGVELMLGRTVAELLHDGGSVSGVLARDRGGSELRLRARLTVGADGRGSKVATLAGVRRRRVRHGRVAYGAYFEDAMPAGAPDASFWLLDPDMVAAFPTDCGLTFYAAMPAKRNAASFREDPDGALVRAVAAVPDAPPIEAGRRVGPTQGKLDMTNVAHAPVASGLALVGDAALAIDPLWGVGCGWALQSAEWLGDSVAPALLGSEGLARGLRRYRLRRARALWAHSATIYDYSGGRSMTPPERMLFREAASDPTLARIMEAYGNRCIGPARMLASAMPRATVLGLRDALRRDSCPAADVVTG